MDKGAKQGRYDRSAFWLFRTLLLQTYPNHLLTWWRYLWALGLHTKDMLRKRDADIKAWQTLCTGSMRHGSRGFKSEPTT